MVLMCFSEPELPDVPDVDKTIVRNVLYTAWALQENSSAPSVSWKVQKISDGYIVSITYGKNFSISLQDLQLVSDVNPLRIDSVIVRGLPGAGAVVEKNTNQTSSSPPPGGCIIAVKVLDQHQRVMITEAEVVRVKKRNRGFLSSLFDYKNHNNDLATTTTTTSAGRI